jgi:hypothetical protein
MTSLIDCLQMMAEPGAYARRVARPLCYVVLCHQQEHLVPTEIFVDLIALRFVEQQSSREWTITRAGQTQAQHEAA